jgi:hypothetical protein
MIRNTLDMHCKEFEYSTDSVVVPLQGIRIRQLRETLLKPVLKCGKEIFFFFLLFFIFLPDKVYSFIFKCMIIATFHAGILSTNRN